MRNWVVSEERYLKNLPMTNALSHLKEFRSVWHHLVFTQTTEQGQGGPWVLWTFQNTD